MKKLLVALIVIVALIAIIVVFTFSKLNSLIAKAIEKEGSKVTQTRVTVSGVDISLRDGRGTVKGLEIASPEGFGARTAISLEDITVGIDIKSVRENPIVISEVHIQAPVVNAEITKTGSINIDELRKRIQASTAGSGGESGDAGSPPKRIRIERFVFEKGRIEIDASALGLEKRTIELPEINLTDVGGAEGAPPNEIVKIILTTVAQRTTSEIGDSEINRLIEEKLGGSVTDKVKDLLHKIGN